MTGLVTLKHTPLTSKKILIFGDKGQLGTALKKALTTFNVISADRETLDVSDSDKVNTYLNKVAPNIIFNAAAFTNVDLAETETLTNKKINAEFPQLLSEYVEKNKDCYLIHYSTDYVYSGESSNVLSEDDSVGPINSYGIEKYNGECAIKKNTSRYLIFRTSWVFDHFHKNFLTTIIKFIENKDFVSIVDDQLGAPTYATDLAKYSIVALEKALLNHDLLGQTYNLCNSGFCSWYEYANFIAKQAVHTNISSKILQITPVSSSEYPTKAKRPKNSRMSTNKFKQTFQVSLPEWKDAINRCLIELKKNTPPHQSL